MLLHRAYSRLRVHYISWIPPHVSSFAERASTSYIARACSRAFASPRRLASAWLLDVVILKWEVEPLIPFSALLSHASQVHSQTMAPDISSPLCSELHVVSEGFAGFSRASVDKQVQIG